MIRRRSLILGGAAMAALGIAATPAMAALTPASEVLPTPNVLRLKQVQLNFHTSEALKEMLDHNINLRDDTRFYLPTMAIGAIQMALRYGEGWKKSNMVWVRQPQYWERLSQMRAAGMLRLRPADWPTLVDSDLTLGGDNPSKWYVVRPNADEYDLVYGA